MFRFFIIDAQLYRGGGGGDSSSSADATLAEQAKLSVCHTYCLRLPTRRGYYLQPLEAEKSLPSCYVCNKSQITLQVTSHTMIYILRLGKFIDFGLFYRLFLKIDTEVSTLEDVVKKVLKGKV